MKPKINTNEYLVLVKKLADSNKFLESPLKLLLRGLSLWKDASMADYNSQMRDSFSEDIVHHLIAVLSCMALGELCEDRCYDDPGNLRDWAVNDYALGPLVLMGELASVAKKNNVVVDMNNHRSDYYGGFVIKLILLKFGTSQASGESVLNEAFENGEMEQFFRSLRIRLYPAYAMKIQAMSNAALN